MVNILTIIVLSCFFLKTYEETVYCGLIVCYSSENKHLLKLPKKCRYFATKGAFCMFVAE